MFKKILLSVVACVTLAQASNFSVDVTNTTNGESFSKGYSTVSNAIDGLNVDAIKE